MIKQAKSVFWDFDGVIKNSVAVKSDAFESLFLPFGKGVAKRVRKHHEENGGMSRFEKIPIYLSWLGESQDDNVIAEYGRIFSQLVKQKVINSEWIAGVLDYLKKNHQHQQFFLVTATPQQEIEEILSVLNIADFFKKIVGSPIKKSHAIKQILNEYNVTAVHAVMIGDSISDYDASIENKVPFILRKTELNKDLQQQLNCKMIENFL